MAMRLSGKACDTSTRHKPPEREGEAANGIAPERQSVRYEYKAQATRAWGRGREWRCGLSGKACDTSTRHKPPEREGEAANGNVA